MTDFLELIDELFKSVQGYPKAANSYEDQGVVVKWSLLSKLKAARDKVKVLEGIVIHGDKEIYGACLDNPGTVLFIPKEEQTAKEIIDITLGEVSALFMRQNRVATEIIMPTEKLLEIGDRLEKDLKAAIKREEKK